MELMLASVIASAIDPIKIVLGTVMALMLVQRRWPFATLIGALLLGYTLFAAYVSGMAGQQVFTHFMSSVAVVAALWVTAKVAGTFWTSAIGLLLTGLATALVWWAVMSAAAQAAPTPSTEEIQIAPQNAEGGTPLPRGTVIRSYLGRTYTTEQMARNIEASRQAASGIVLVTSTGRRFAHGGNIAVQFGKELYRKSTAGPSNPEWRAGEYRSWLEANRPDIPVSADWRYAGTGNQKEAELLLEHDRQDRWANQINSFL
jgi:hypothetical protein